MTVQAAVDKCEQSTAALRKKVESVTAEMSRASEQGDWQLALDLGNLRRDLLEALFQAVRDPNEEVDLIERILESDRMLAEQARAARSLVADELAGRREKKRALSAYREAASRET